MTGTPFGAPAGLLQRLTRGQVRVGDLVAAVEGLGTAPPEPGLQLTVEQGDVLLVEDGRRTRVPLEELADRMSRAHVRATPQGVTAALRSQSRQALSEIAGALRHLAEGSYGRCLDCASEISTERLQARPDAVSGLPPPVGAATE